MAKNNATKYRTPNLPSSVALLLCCVLIPFTWLSPRAAHADVNLVFGTYAFEKPTETVAKVRPILDVLEQEMSQRLGQPVNIKLRIAKDYRSAVNDMVDGVVDFGRYGQAAYIIGQSTGTIDILAVEGDHAKKTFRSMIVVHENSLIKSVSDLSGKSFAFGDEYSTTGRYLPQAFLARNGITATDLGHYDYLNRHDRVGTSVARNEFDAGAISEWVFQDLQAKGVALRPIASFSSVTKPWTARQDLSNELKETIRDSLIAMRGVPVLGYIKKDCFLPGNDDDYSDARDAIAMNWEFFAE